MEHQDNYVAVHCANKNSGMAFINLLSAGNQLGMYEWHDVDIDIVIENMRMLTAEAMSRATTVASLAA